MISVIIPAYNEAADISETINTVRKHDKAGLVNEIVVADGGSTDSTVQHAEAAGAQVVHSPRKGRAAQLNAGAKAAASEVLYFLHADSVPPSGFSSDIIDALNAGYGSGCYRLAFDHRHWFLQLNCWFTRFNVDSVRFGDQSLFVTKKVFEEAGGFREDHIVMEDQEIISRLRKYSSFKVIPRAVTTSARKYLDNGIYRMQAIFFRIWLLYKLGRPQQELLSTYRRLITQDKL